MEIFESYIWWIILVITAVIVYAYIKISKKSNTFYNKFKTVKKISGTSPKIMSMIKEALNNSGFKNVGFNNEESRFYAQSKFSMSSWSEYIEVKINNSQKDTEITFKSICAHPFQVFDWGKNERNYMKFEKELKKLIPTRSISNT
jgi:hypothetical protein